MVGNGGIFANVVMGCEVVVVVEVGVEEKKLFILLFVVPSPNDVMMCNCLGSGSCFVG